MHNVASTSREYPLVSVVIPTFNRAHMISDAISSVLSQTMSELELIVVDDRSTDGTKSVVEAVTDPRVRYAVNDRSQGPSGARNAGVLIARGEWVGFLDSDDEWMARKLERQLDRLRRRPEAQAISCGWRWINKRTGETRLERSPDSRGMIKGVQRWAFNICPDVLLRREVARDTLFREELHAYECLDWIIRLQDREFLYLPEILVNCHDHEEARASDNSLRCLTALEDVVRRHSSFIRRDPVAWSIMKERLGAGLLVASGDRRRARSHLVDSVRARPGRLRAWGYLVAAIVPGGRRLGSLRRRRGSSNPRSGNGNGIPHGE